MSLTPRLSRKLQQALGDDAAEELVTWMQRVDAQRAELRELNELNFSRVDARFAEARQATQADLAEVRQEVHALREEMARMEGRLEARFERRFADLLKWSFVFWVGAVAAVALLAGVLG